MKNKMTFKHRMMWLFVISYIRWCTYSEKVLQVVDSVVLFIEGPWFEFNFYWNWREDGQEENREAAHLMEDAFDSAMTWKCPECGEVTMEATLHRNRGTCNHCDLPFSRDTFERRDGVS